MQAEVAARRSSRSLLATPARYSSSARRSGRLGADARSRSAAPHSLALNNAPHWLALSAAQLSARVGSALWRR